MTETGGTKAAAPVPAKKKYGGGAGPAQPAAAATGASAASAGGKAGPLGSPQKWCVQLEGVCEFVHSRRELASWCTGSGRRGVVKSSGRAMHCVQSVMH